MKHDPQAQLNNRIHAFVQRKSAQFPGLASLTIKKASRFEKTFAKLRGHRPYRRSVHSIWIDMDTVS